jgi:sodium transport system permease protein
MFNTAIIRSVYAKEFSEFMQDTRTLLIVFLIPLLLMPAVTLTTYSSGLSADESATPSKAIIASNCNAAFNQNYPDTICFDTAEHEEAVEMVRTARLSAVLDMDNQRVYYANAGLTPQDIKQDIERLYLHMSSGLQPVLTISDMNSEQSVVNIIGTSLANVLVMIIITFSFVGALNFGIDVTTGEKERGSFRLYAEFKDKITSIFAGKLMFTSFCSGLTAMLGIVGIVVSILSVEFFFGANENLTQTEVDKIGAFFQYIRLLSVTDLLVVMAYLFPCIILISSFVNLFGCIAKNMKEAKLFGVVLIALIIALTKVDLGADNFFYTAFVPVLNVFAGINKSLSFDVNLTHLAISILINLSICVNNLFDIKKLIVKEKV